MRIATSHSLKAGAGEGGGEAVSALVAALGGAPDFLVVYATEHHADPALIKALAAGAPGAQIIGGTSCGGVMTEAGFHTGADGAIGLLGVCDPDGAYGVGAAPLAASPFAAGAEAIQKALSAAGRDYEAPILIWCSQPPGCEEQVIDGVQSIVGPKTPIVGGSSADEAIEGRWRQFSNDGVLADHVVVAALFPSAPYGAAFQSGYAPTGDTGVVTRADGRRVLEIDNKPASEVYSRWTGGEVSAFEAGMILAKSTPTPLGRVAARQDSVPMFVLSHPALLGVGGELSLFTDIAEGDHVHLMRGSPESLVKRAAVVVRDAMASSSGPGQGSLGALVIYCGGCMLHVRERMDEVAEQVREAIDGSPFLGAFTFGEQGAIIDSCNRHGNLMVSAVTFG